METLPKKTGKELKAEQKKMSDFNFKVLAPLATTEYSHYYDLIVNNPQQIARLGTDLGPIYRLLWEGYSGEDASYCINRYLRTGDFSFKLFEGTSKSGQAFSENLEKKSFNELFSKFISSIVEIIPLSDTITKESISNLLIENNVVAQNDYNFIEYTNRSFSVIKSFIKQNFISKLEVKEKMDILIKYYDLSFSYEGSVGNAFMSGPLLPLVNTTTGSEVFYRGIGNLSAEEFKEELEKYPEKIAYTSTTSDFNVASWHACHNVEIEGGDMSNKLVVEFVPDPGINIINIVEGIKKDGFAWEKEFIFPRGCILTFEKERVIENYDTLDVFFSVQIKSTTDSMKVVTVRISHPSASASVPAFESSPIGGRKNRRNRQSRKSMKHRNSKKCRNSKKKCRNSKKRYTRKY